ncbi:Molybdopterin biosynthesis protein MoeA (fragment) [Roseovarius sp. EC-SD190]
MNRFDTFAMLDWSGGNDTGPRPCRDAIWLGVTRDGVDEAPMYLRNRAEAEAALMALIAAELAAGRRLLIGVDFPFGFPAGFARGLTGCDNPFAVWDWLETVIEDAPGGNNRFDVAGEINGRFPGVGPFWFNGLKREIDGLPRKDTRAGHGMAEKRAAEARAPGAFTCWQVGGF